MKYMRIGKNYIYFTLSCGETSLFLQNKNSEFDTSTVHLEKVSTYHVAVLSTGYKDQFSEDEAQD